MDLLASREVSRCHLPDLTRSWRAIREEDKWWNRGKSLFAGCLCDRGSDPRVDPVWSDAFRRPVLFCSGLRCTHGNLKTQDYPCHVSSSTRFVKSGRCSSFRRGHGTREIFLSYRATRRASEVSTERKHSSAVVILSHVPTCAIWNRGYLKRLFSECRGEIS